MSSANTGHQQARMTAAVARRRLHTMPHDVRLADAVGPEVRVAAREWTERQEERADGCEEGSSYFYAWALFSAFCAGVHWQQEAQER